LKGSSGGGEVPARGDLRRGHQEVERYQPGVTFGGVIRRWRGSAGDNQPTFDSKGSSTRGL